MGKREMTKAIVGAVLLGAPSVGLAQNWVPGSEITGQSVQVETNGVTNTVYFDPGGAARIQTPAGNTVPGTWAAANGQLCLTTDAAQECWPYAAAIPGRPAAFTDEQLQCRFAMDCAEHQHGARSGGRRRARPLGQLTGASSPNFGMSTSNVSPSSSTIR